MKHKITAAHAANRKPKAPEELLASKLAVRLTTQEKDCLDSKAASRGITTSQLCRAILMRRKIPDRSLETRDYLRAIIGMKNNLNQLAHIANTAGFIDAQVKEGIQYLTCEIQQAKILLTQNKELKDEKPL